MRHLLIALALLAGPTLRPAPAAAAGHATEKEPFTVIDSAALEKQLAAKDSKVKLYDVNTNGFRETNGVIPGAVQLTSFDKFSAFDLPENKGTPLVFYCANSH